MTQGHRLPQLLCFLLGGGASEGVELVMQPRGGSAWGAERGSAAGGFPALHLEDWNWQPLGQVLLNLGCGRRLVLTVRCWWGNGEDAPFPFKPWRRRKIHLDSAVGGTILPLPCLTPSLGRIQWAACWTAGAVPSGGSLRPASNAEKGGA